jgi:DNA-binding Lrp family transcriptional regulator
MNMPSGEMAAMVFQRLQRDDLGEFSVDSRMLTILMELDGQRTLSQIAHACGMEPKALQAIVTRLLDLKLIAPVQAATATLDTDFIAFLSTQMSQAVGPIAEILLEDAVYDLGHELNQFPAPQVAELVDYLAREIQRPDKAMAFKQNILSKIREKGY